MEKFNLPQTAAEWVNLLQRVPPETKVEIGWSGGPSSDSPKISLTDMSLVRRESNPLLLVEIELLYVDKEDEYDDDDDD